jgi:uncharacterized protein YjbI with pentapeptide repeats
VARDGRSEGEQADLSQSNLHGASLSGASLQWADLQGADLRQANLQGADLFSAELQGANLGRAKLQKASLNGANLKDANPFFANFRAAILANAKGLTRKQLDEACGDDETGLPDYLADYQMKPCPTPEPSPAN